MKRTSKLIVFVLVAAMLLLSMPTSLLAKPTRTVPEGYNEHDYMKVVDFLEIEDDNGVKNGTKLNPAYNPEDPETWLAVNQWGETYGFRFVEIDEEQRLSQVAISALATGVVLVGQLDLEGCSELVEMYCALNELNGVIVLGCTSLQKLVASHNSELAELNVTQCPALANLTCHECCIGELDVTHNSELTHLYVYNNPIGELDVSQCPNLQVLDCENCGLTELNVNNNPLLYELCLGWNHIRSLDISHNANLQILYADITDLTELDTSANPELRFISCHSNYITEFDFTDNPNLILDIVRAEQGGYVGCMSDNVNDVSDVYAEPWEGFEFIGWFDENDNLISDESYHFTSGEEGTVFIARFSGGSEPTPGDVDGNGEVAVSDAVLALRAAMGIHELSAEQTAAADMDENGSIEVSDAIIILRVAMGLLG